MSGHAKMPPASHQVSATSLKLLIQQIHPHVRVECDSGMCVARDLYEPAARSAKTDACGRSFAVLSTQVSTDSFRLRHNTLTRGSILKVSRDAVAAEEEQLASCAAEQSKYCTICTETLDPCGDLPFTSWVRRQCLRGGADGLDGCSAACDCGTDNRCGALLG